MTARRGAARTYVAIAGLVVLSVLFGSLSVWQWRRAETSRTTLTQFASGAADAALAELPDELDSALRFRRIEVAGEYVEEPQFLLDNMLHEGAAGYHVLTALRVQGTRRRLLVNRGWVRADGDRRALPGVDVSGELRAVAGRLERLPRPGMRLGDAAAVGPSSGTVVVQFPTAAELAERLGAPVFDYQLLLDASAADGYVRDWRAPGVAPERHLSYAGQWLALALFAFGAAAVMTFRTMRGARRET